MSKIIFFEANIDEMGGVERVISTLANNLCDSNEIEVISLYKTRKTTFFDYNKNIKKTYLQSNLKSKKYNSHSIRYFCYKVLEKIYRLTILKYKKNKISKHISKDDILVFGRISMALEWIPKYFDKNYNIIVRDASHYYCHNEKEKNSIKTLLKNIKLFVVSSDESINVYKSLIPDYTCEIKKIYNPLGIIPNRRYTFESKKIIAVGRCDFQKGYNVLLNAFKIVHEKYVDWKLEIVGNYDEELLNLINELNLNENIILTKESKNIVQKLNNSAIYITTSRFEGYANSLVEAVACGVPSISVDWLLGPDEIIIDDYNGKIVKLKDRHNYAKGIDCIEDYQEIANGIINLINNPKLCEKYSQNSKEILKSRDKQKILEIWNMTIKEMNNIVNK